MGKLRTLLTLLLALGSDTLAAAPPDKGHSLARSDESIQNHASGDATEARLLQARSDSRSGSGSTGSGLSMNSSYQAYLASQQRSAGEESSSAMRVSRPAVPTPGAGRDKNARNSSPQSSYSQQPPAKRPTLAQSGSQPSMKLFGQIVQSEGSFQPAAVQNTRRPVPDRTKRLRQLETQAQQEFIAAGGRVEAPRQPAGVTFRASDSQQPTASGTSFRPPTSPAGTLNLFQLNPGMRPSESGTGTRSPPPGSSRNRNTPPHSPTRSGSAPRGGRQ